jgi:carbamoyltransferase
MKVLGLNLSHNASACLINNGEIVYFLEESLLSRIKHDRNIDCLLKFFANQSIDTIIWGAENTYYGDILKNKEEEILLKCDLNNIKVKKIKYYNEHHLYHAASAVFNSKFKESYCFIADGRGVSIFDKEKNFVGYEYMSLYYFNGKSFETIYKIVTSDKPFKVIDNIINLPTLSLGHLYNYVRRKFNLNEVGSVMAAASIGSVVNKKNNQTILHHFDNDHYLLNHDYIHENRQNDLITSAFDIQNDLEIILEFYVNKIIQKNKDCNICFSGGIFQNCQVNYKLLNISKNIFIDPVAHDGGTSLGMAQLECFLNKIQIKPYTNLFLGNEPVYDDNLNYLKSRKTNSTEIAKIISEGNLVAIFQGRPESGPRALGNRSFLFDPRDIFARDKINLIKKREWFRPFAGTVLYEHAHDWFDLNGKDEMEYMSYASVVKKQKTNLIPGVVHIDNTCRIQTLKKDQNVNFYNLINEFYKITNVPLLLNTSFNISGQPLVCSVQDAINTMFNNNFNYIYFPEINLLVNK